MGGLDMRITVTFDVKVRPKGGRKKDDMDPSDPQFQNRTINAFSEFLDLLFTENDEKLVGEVHWSDDGRLIVSIKRIQPRIAL